MGAFEVSERGDLANWTTDDPTFAPGVGGAMDLAAGARHVRIMLDHTTKAGVPRLRRQCAFPLTAPSCVERVYTDLAVIDIEASGFVVREMVPNITREALQAKTDAPLRFADFVGLLGPPQLA